MLYLVVSIIEAIYIFYMYIFFKTKWYIHHPAELWLQKQNIGNWFKHPLSSDIYDSKICPLGNIVGVLLPIWILIKYIYRSNTKIQKVNIYIWITVFLVSLFMNLNAFIYLIPVFLIEYLHIYYSFGT